MLALPSTPQQDDRDNDSDANYARKERSETSNPVSVTIANPIQIERENSVETAWDEPNCKTPKSHDEADLCQQIRVADAADVTLSYSRWQIALSVATVLGLALTVLYARNSTRAAIVAAKAANSSAVVAEEAFRRLERPYLYIKITETTLLRQTASYKAPPGIQYQLWNHGKLPAILHSISIGLLNSPEFPLKSTMATTEPTYEIIWPGSAAKDFRFIRVCDAPVGDHFQGARATNLVLYGILEYDDPTGARHTDSFLMRGLPNATAFVIDGGEEYNWHETSYPGDRSGKKPGA
ncbi:hypothetical protein [Rhodopseudomonas palustris]|uniref:hypothetical protein n=1 Tax=Rhodopseudomonas palustris TaxID=1076 RepID=UPI0009B5D0E0